eukprot:UN25396
MHKFCRGTLWSVVMEDQASDLEELLTFPLPNGDDHLRVRDSDNFTIIDLCMQFQSIACVEKLIALKKFDHNSLNASNKPGFSMLHMAAKYNKLDLADFLKNIVDDIDQFTTDGRTALHIAAQEELEQMTLLLLRAGACPNIQKRDSKNEKEPPLNLTKKEDIARWLIAYGARVDHKKSIARSWTDSELSQYQPYFEEVSGEKTDIQKQLVTKGSEKWQPDDVSEMCMLCNIKFTQTTRRHHCRKCGKLVCNQCSRRKLRFSMGNNNKVRYERSCDCCVNKSHTESKQKVEVKSEDGKSKKVIPKYALEL